MTCTRASAPRALMPRWQPLERLTNRSRGSKALAASHATTRRPNATAETAAATLKRRFVKEGYWTVVQWPARHRPDSESQGPFRRAGPLRRRGSQLLPDAV